MAKHGSKKHRLIRALLGMKHSPEGKKYLKGEGRYKPKKKTQPVYFRGMKRKSDEQRLIDAGLSEDDLRSLGIKK